MAGFGATNSAAGFGAFSPATVCGAAPGAGTGLFNDGVVLLLFGGHAAYGCEVVLGCACTGTGTTTFELVPSDDDDDGDILLLLCDTCGTKDDDDDGTVCCCRCGVVAGRLNCDDDDDTEDDDDDTLLLACLPDRCFEELDELVVRLELDCDVDNWSWTNIM